MGFGWSCINVGSSVVTSVPLWWGMLIMRETNSRGARVRGKSLYLPPNFVVNLKLLLKNNNNKKTTPRLYVWLYWFYIQCLSLKRALYIKGPQFLGCRPVPVPGLIVTGQHSRRWEAGDWVKFHLYLKPLSSTSITTSASVQIISH